MRSADCLTQPGVLVAILRAGLHDLSEAVPATLTTREAWHLFEQFAALEAQVAELTSKAQRHAERLARES